MASLLWLVRKSECTVALEQPWLVSCSGEGCEQGQDTEFRMQQLWVTGITWAL